eukprot:1240287-Rhodomonas_salina.2
MQWGRQGRSRSRKKNRRNTTSEAQEHEEQGKYEDGKGKGDDDEEEEQQQWEDEERRRWREGGSRGVPGADLEPGFQVLGLCHVSSHLLLPKSSRHSSSSSLSHAARRTFSSPS